MIFYEDSLEKSEAELPDHIVLKRRERLLHGDYLLPQKDHALEITCNAFGRFSVIHNDRLNETTRIYSIGARTLKDGEKIAEKRLGLKPGELAKLRLV